MRVREHAVAWAIGASVAVHGVLFAALWRPLTPSKPTPFAVQVLSRAPGGGAKMPLAASPAPQVRLARATPARRGPPPVAETSRSGDDEPSAPAEVGPPGAAVGDSAGTGSALPSGAGGSVAVGTPGGAGSGGGDAASWTALHEKLEAAARECYPDAARRFRLRGEVELDFCVGPGGHAVSAHLGGTTGSGALDRAAQECVLSRSEPLGVDRGCFRVPIRFGAP